MLKGVFRVCTDSLKTPHNLTKKSINKSIILIYNLKIYLLYLFYSNIFNFIYIYINF